MLAGWPGVQVYSPQPMKAQIRAVLARSQANSGEAREALLSDCGHTPHIEKPKNVSQHLGEFLAVLA